MTDFNKSWTRLVDAAASTQEEDTIETSAGFATRVVAQAFSQNREMSVLELLLPKVLGVSCFIMALTIASYFFVLNNTYESQLLLADQLTSELFLQ